MATRATKANHGARSKANPGPKGARDDRRHEAFSVEKLAPTFTAASRVNGPEATAPAPASTIAMDTDQPHQIGGAGRPVSIRNNPLSNQHDADWKKKERRILKKARA